MQLSVSDRRARIDQIGLEIKRRKLRKLFSGESGLLEFVRYFWHILEPQTPFVEGWALEAMCLHLQAVSLGDIQRLLINVPPGFMKSLLVDVLWPAWEWAIIGSHLRYVAFSYSSELTRRDNRKFGAVVASREYQELFDVQLVKQGEEIVSNKNTGYKLATSIGGVGTGERGNRVILDDPHNVKDSESEGVRQETVRWFREAMFNRLNDMDKDAIVIIMQRVHGDDVSGVILSEGMDYVHLMIPMEYDYDRQTNDNYEPVTTSIGWYDPRYDEYDPANPEVLSAWPERFPERAIDRMKSEGTTYGWAAQYEQSPVPRGGGIFQRDWWQLWDSPDGKFPVFEYLIASVDSAFTEQERNDPTALTIWGIWRRKDENGEERNRLMLVHAWRKHLKFSGARKDVDPFVNEGRIQWVQRTQKAWGLMEWIKYSCERYKVDNLLIEAKASGISAAEELSNRYGRLSFGVQAMPVKGSKEARALSVQWIFAQGLVYAPVRDWSEDVITEMEAFPMHKYDDLTDSTTQALKFIKDNNLLIDDAEAEAQERDALYHGGKKTDLSFW